MRYFSALLLGFTPWLDLLGRTTYGERRTQPITLHQNSGRESGNNGRNTSNRISLPSFQVCEDIRVAQIGPIAQDCRCGGTQRQRTASVKAAVGIWELIKPALVSALAEPIL
jgi:hypothetical protein